MDALTLIVNNACFDPAYNLACEEYLLMNDDFQNDIFMLWRNDRSVIIGKNQNTYSQLNVDFVKENNIKVIRRLTGGGAVFHDLGNVNFTYITKADSETNIDFSAFAKPVVSSLKKLFLNAELSGRNDICIDGKKISGTAQCILNNKVMHHGTLLYSANMSSLAGALKVADSKLKDKGIKSVKSRVTNIADLLDKPMPVESFIQFLADSISEYYSELKIEKIDFNPMKVPEICELYNKKYSTWEWNFGNSPEFEFKNEKRFSFGSIEIHLTVDGGIIKDIAVFGDFFGKKDIGDIVKLLSGNRFDKESIKSVIQNVNIGDYIFGCTTDDFISMFMIGD